MRRALVVRGGWEGHQPAEATEMFVPFLREHGFAVRVEESTEVYADEAVMADADLIVQCVTMSSITREQVAGLRTAVASGTGFTGWHGGIADSFRESADYLQLVGGQFAAHPGVDGEYAVSHEIAFTELGRRHPVTVGLVDFTLRTEQYWVLTDDLNDVLATTTHPARTGEPWQRAVTVPAIWTREWGAGRIVVCTPGHDLDVLAHPTVRTVAERGILWAARPAR